MTKVIYYLVFMLCSLVAGAQTTTSTATATATTKQDGEVKSHSSVSINNTDTFYSLNADFDKNKTTQVKNLLADNLDKKHMISNGSTVKWIKEQDGETVYSFVLSNGKLRVSIDKELMSEAAFEKFKALGEKISKTISGK
jgi:hypothetical protein